MNDADALQLLGDAQQLDRDVHGERLVHRLTQVLVDVHQVLSVTCMCTLVATTRNMKEYGSRDAE